MKTKNRNMQKW